MRTVVVQVESCEVALLVGYRPGSGEATESILSRAASQPKSQGITPLRDLLAMYAMGPLGVSADGAALVPTSVRAKIGVEDESGRPMIVLLVTYALPRGRALAITSTDARTTRFSWQDRESHRVSISDAPAQGQWFAGVASFLLNLDPTSGGSACASSATSSSPPPPRPSLPPATSRTTRTRPSSIRTRRASTS